MNPAQTISTRGHRPRMGESQRVSLSSTRVDLATFQQMAAWQEVLRMRPGVLTDKLVRFAITHGFTAWAKKEAASVSTPHAASQISKSYTSPQRAAPGSRVNSKA